MTSHRPFCAVVPAAGEGRRYGGVKALAPVDGDEALTVVARRARRAGAADVVVVTGYHRDQVAAAARRCGAREACNPAPERGMIGSVRVGLTAAGPGRDVLLWPVDHPFVSEETVRRLVGARDGRAVVPTHAGRGGHPVLLPADWHADVLALDDQGGLDRLVRASSERVLRLSVDDPAVLWNVNTRADLERYARARRPEAGHT